MSKIAKATAGLMVATIIAKVLGFGREVVLASTYGASAYSDAYLIALNIPNVIVAAIGQAIITTFIPLYYESKQTGEKESSLKFVNNIMNITILLCIVLSVLGIIFTEPLVKVFAMGFKGETLRVAIYFTKVLMLSIVFLGLSYLMIAFLQANNNFFIPGIMSLPYNIIVIISIILSVRFGYNVMIWGTVIGISSQIIFMIPFIIKNGFKYKLYINFKDPYFKKMMVLIFPVLISVFANQMNVLIDRTLASTLAEGSVSALNYANKLNLFVIGLFITSIISVIYPMLSKLSSQEESSKFNNTVVKSINTIILLIMPVTVGAIVLSKPIVTLLFKRGAFDDKAVQMTSIALILYSLGLIGIGLKDMLRRVFFSLKDTKTPMVNSIIAIVINIVLNLILVKVMGYAGLALATSISAILTTVLMFRSLKIKIGDFGQSKILKLFAKSMFASIIMGIITYMFYNNLVNILGISFLETMISLVLSIIIGVIIYGIMIFILRVEELNVIFDIVKKVKTKS